MPGLSADQVIARLGTTSRPFSGPGGPGLAIDDRPGARPAGAAAAPLIPAAVLVPLVPHPEPTVLLTLRGRHLKAHAGQVSFPGGRIEPEDRDATAAALREAEEEIGLSPASVRVLGSLPEHVTGTGYSVIPVVALVSPPLALRPDPSEVDEVFELPLSRVLDPASQRFHHVELLGRPRASWIIAHERHLIWGATAAMLVTLGRALRGDQQPRGQG